MKIYSNCPDLSGQFCFEKFKSKNSKVKIELYLQGHIFYFLLLNFYFIKRPDPLKTIQPFPAISPFYQKSYQNGKNLFFIDRLFV